MSGYRFFLLGGVLPKYRIRRALREGQQKKKQQRAFSGHKP
jgi:hypothetical protein